MKTNGWHSTYSARCTTHALPTWLCARCVHAARKGRPVTLCSRSATTATRSSHSASPPRFSSSGGAKTHKSTFSSFPSPPPSPSASASVSLIPALTSPVSSDPMIPPRMLTRVMKRGRDGGVGKALLVVALAVSAVGVCCPARCCGTMWCVERGKAGAGGVT